mmetsp:Transcript_69779/g.226945  ORF Transcript_69779/g.226945 Transcript_69779/m.226945 type:complete len:204 (+) Transcript_69779:48-659(+)
MTSSSVVLPAGGAASELAVVSWSAELDGISSETLTSASCVRFRISEPSRRSRAASWLRNASSRCRASWRLWLLSWSCCCSDASFAFAAPRSFLSSASWDRSSLIFASAFCRTCERSTYEALSSASLECSLAFSHWTDSSREASACAAAAPSCRSLDSVDCQTCLAAANSCLTSARSRCAVARSVPCTFTSASEEFSLASSSTS